MYYRNRIDAFQFPSPRYWNETETRKARTRRAARDREGRGKKTFSDRCDYFQIANTGEEEGTANPSARGVNRDKRRIVLRIQSVTIRAAYGVREGRGEGGRGHDVTIRGNAHWLKQAYLERNKFHDKLEGFRYDLQLF